MEIEKAARIHENAKTTILDKLSGLENEADVIQSKIEAFEKTAPGLRIIADNLTPKQLVKDARQDYLSAWDETKASLTKRVKLCLLNQDCAKLVTEVEQCIDNLEKIGSNIPNESVLNTARVYVGDLESNVLPNLWKIYRSLHDQTQGVEILKAKEKLSQLEERVEDVKKKMGMMDEYFEINHALERIIGETNLKLDERLSAAEPQIGDIKTTLELFKRNFQLHEEKMSVLMKSLNMAPSNQFAILRRDYEKTIHSVTQILVKLSQQPPPRPPPSAVVAPHFERGLQDTHLMEGEACLMTAKVHGDPFPAITHPTSTARSEPLWAVTRLTMLRPSSAI